MINNIYIYIIYIYVQWRPQDLAQGGYKIGREAPEKFCTPPGHFRGGTGGVQEIQGGYKPSDMSNHFSSIYMIIFDQNKFWM